MSPVACDWGFTSGVEGHGMYVLYQQSQTFLAPGTGCMEDNFPQNEGWGGLGVVQVSEGLTGLPLLSCCSARFLTGCALWGEESGLATPVLQCPGSSSTLGRPIYQVIWVDLSQSCWVSAAVLWFSALIYLRSEVKSLTCVWLFATPWTVAYQVPPSMGFSRQEYWSGLPLPSSEILLTQGLNPGLLHCRQTLYRLSHQGSPGFISCSIPPAMIVLHLCPRDSRILLPFFWQLKAFVSHERMFWKELWPVLQW